MNRADTRTGLHGYHRFDAHRHVNDDAIAFFDAARLQPVGKLADAGVQVAVIDSCHLTVIRLENDCGLFSLSGQMCIQAVVGNIQFTVFKPFVEGSRAFVQHSRERFFPLQGFARQPTPETGVVLLCLGA